MEHHSVTEDAISFALIHSDHNYNFLAARRRKISSDLSVSSFGDQRVEFSRE